MKIGERERFRSSYAYQNEQKLSEAAATSVIISSNDVFLIDKIVLSDKARLGKAREWQQCNGCNYHTWLVLVKWASLYCALFSTFFSSHRTSKHNDKNGRFHGNFWTALFSRNFQLERKERGKETIQNMETIRFVKYNLDVWSRVQFKPFDLSDMKRIFTSIDLKNKTKLNWVWVKTNVEIRTSAAIMSFNFCMTAESSPS